jgi:hypothetical protein
MSDTVDPQVSSRLDTAKAMVADVLGEHERLVAEHGPNHRGWRDAGVDVVLHEKVNDLVEYLLDAYPEVGTAEEATRIFETGEGAYTFDDVPAGVFALFVVRHLLRVKKVMFSFQRVPAFWAFADRYRHIVLS